MVCWSIGTPTFRSTTWDIHLGGPSEHCQEDLIAREPWDIIIDDGSHVPYHQVFSFFSLWKAVVPGGLYVIEDVETNYWKPGRMVYWHLGGTCESEFDISLQEMWPCQRWQHHLNRRLQSPGY